MKPSQFLVPSVPIRIVASGLLIWALAPHAYGYYSLLRWVVCAASAYCVYISNSVSKPAWVWFFGLSTIMFNPFIPIRLDRVTWSYVDVGMGIMFLISTVFVRENESGRGDQSPRAANDIFK